MSRIPSTSRKMTLSVLLLLLLPLFLSMFIHEVNSQQQSSNNENRDQEILLRLKTEFQNPPTLDSWKPSSGSPCNWVGINCTEAGVVTGILLRDMNITTKIPNSICELENLTDIDLSLNFIPGEFPTHLYNCSKLQLLDLSQNYFIGRIPSDIYRISTLQYLLLSANNFSGDIPTSIGNLPELRVLSLVQNEFNGTYPPEIGNLSNLEVLELAYNEKFLPSRFPSEFKKLKKLKYLWMKDTNLIGEIPISIGDDYPSLRHFDLSINNLNGSIPTSLFQLKNLTHLYLQFNNLSNEIPRKIETTNLIAIDLSRNALTGTIPEAFGKCTHMTDFDMYTNRLSGEIPASIGRIPALKNTRLFRNNLSGVLPPELGLHSNLEGVEVSENRLSGSLPEGLCAKGVLMGVTAFSNNFTGELPETLAKCDSLTTIELYDNRFSGEVPYEVWSLKNLLMINIRDNKFSGELPDKLGSNLDRVEIANNMFSGRIPKRIADSENLNLFVASNNMFSGEIPIGLTALPRLNTLYLDRNQLVGNIPAEIIGLRSLAVLNLSRNQLTGELPPTLGLLPGLNALDLSGNLLVGEIPSQLGNVRFTTLNLSSNRLSGKIPNQLENLAYDRSFMNNSGLCADNPDLSLRSCNVGTRGSSRLSPQMLAIIVVVFAGVVFSAIMLLALYVVRDLRRKRHAKDLITWKLTSFQRLDFTEADILSSLTENNVIGSGGSGKVYRVAVNQSGYVAVKKIWNKGKLEQKLEKEFLTEVQILGMIRHANVVKLLCCISSESSKILVYEYMENGSLDQWLHKQGTSAFIRRSILDWPKRLQIAIGAAQGLSYLHHNCLPPIVHRDVKSSNILLDSEFKARIADFGVAKMLVKHGEPNTASVIAGSFGYIAPEYGHTSKINEKIDVYSFGVVLLELATGREPNDGDEHTCLAEWAWRQYQEDKPLIDALDKDVKDSGYLDEMMMVFKLGLICTSTLPSTRPSMKEIVHILLRHDPLRSYKQNKPPVSEYDAAPLLNEPTNRLTSYKGSRHKRSSSNADDDDSEDNDENFACNVLVVRTCL